MLATVTGDDAFVGQVEGTGEQGNRRIVAGGKAVAQGVGEVLTDRRRSDVRGAFGTRGGGDPVRHDNHPVGAGGGEVDACIVLVRGVPQANVGRQTDSRVIGHRRPAVQTLTGVIPRIVVLWHGHVLLLARQRSGEPVVGPACAWMTNCG